ncbi:MAG TPA: CbiX/SirB N-terminal domain-containing protein, partial [Streptosporangiaceae bacterium]
MSRPVLLAVAHGSRDPRAQVTTRALAGRVSGLAPGLDVRTAFVQHAEPSLPGALAAAIGDGRPEVTIVPLLLAPGYHLSQDITGAAAQTGVPVAGPLGPDPRLIPALA